MLDSKLVAFESLIHSIFLFENTTSCLCGNPLKLFTAFTIFLSLRPKFIDEYIINNYQVDFFYIANILSILTLIIIYFLSLIQIRILEKKINTIIRAESLKKIIKKIKE